MTALASFWPVLLVGLGGTLGALSRFAVDTVIGGTRGVVVVTVLGSVVLGGLVASSVGSEALLVFGTGYCGAFTTFSSFAVGVAERVERGERTRAAGYAGAMLLLALVGVAVGGGFVRLLG